MITPDQRSTLLNLHRNALTLWGKASKTNKGWQEAFDADDAFIRELDEVTE